MNNGVPIHPDARGGRFSGRWRFIIVAVALLCSSVPATVLAWRDPPPLPGGHKKHKASYEVIASVDEGAGTVLIGHANSSNRTTKSLKVTKFTDITVDGQKATLHDLKKGMMVEVTQGGDADEAAALKASHVD
jgi:hypothetical protein